MARSKFSSQPEMVVSTANLGKQHVCRSESCQTTWRDVGLKLSNNNQSEMIIVLFHVLYLFGKYVYDNLNGRKDETEVAATTNQLLNVTEADYRDFPQPDYDSKNVKIKFFPPVYVQRYTTVQHVLASGQYQGKIRKVIDFGCAELSFAIHLKNTEGVQEIICVDVDRAVLESFKSRVAPLHCDYLSLRTEPLKIYVFEGSIAHSDNKLANSDAVTAIELIEHLYPDDLDAFPYNVFGFIKPQVAIVTTPNADFNVLFKEMKGFRHPDHKFEWTRKQFQDWADNIVSRYPDYEVSFHGIGAGPPGTEQFGSCSQMAVFHRHTQQLYEEEINGADGLLKTVVFHDYPYRADNRSDEEKILDEAVYYIRLFSSRDEEMMEEIPLEKLMFSVNKFRISVDTLRSILADANWAIADREDGPVVLVPPQSTFSNNSNLNLDNFLEADYRYQSDNDWNDLEPGAPSGYLFDSYMERDTQGYEEEEENWDEEMEDGRRSSGNSNLDNVPNAELHLSENLMHTLDSQWTIDDLNNEDSSSDVPQNQPNVTQNTSNLETELPSDSFSIRLDRADVDHLETPSNTIDSSKRNSSSPNPLSDLSEVSRSLGSADGDLLSECRSIRLMNNVVKKSAPSDASNTDMCVERTKNFLAFNATVINPLKSKENRGTVENPLSLFAKCEAIEIDCRLLSNETSSVSTEEATLLLSREQSLLMNNEKHLSPATLRSSEREEFLINCREGVKEGIAPQSNDAFLQTDRFESGVDNYADMCSMYLQPSSMSNNFYDTSNDVSLDITDLLAANNISTRSDLRNSEQGETDPVNEEKMEFEGAKSQDSMSFKSMSDCSLDLQPKYASSPQISTDCLSVQPGETDDRAERFLEKEHLYEHVSQSLIVEDTNAENTYQCRKKRKNTKDESDCRCVDQEVHFFFRNDDLPESKTSVNNDRIALQKENFVKDEKINENNTIINLTESKIVDNISPTASQLSLHSDNSLSTVTSTRSSNVDRWYIAETNPMYQRDVVMLKGGNDAADNPNEETNSDSDAAAADIENSKNTEIIEVIAQGENTADSCSEVTENRLQDDSNKEKTEKLDRIVRSAMDEETAIIRSSSSPKGGINAELSSDFIQRESDENMKIKDNLTDLKICFENKSENTDEIFAARVEETFDDTYEKSISLMTANDSIISEDFKCSIYEVAKTLNESTKKISEKIDQTKSRLESSLETTKRMLEVSPLVRGKTEPDTDIHESVPEHLNDAKKIGFSNLNDEKESPKSFDALGIINIGELSEQLNKSMVATNFKPTPSGEVSTSYNVNKIGKERSHLRCELEPTRGLEIFESKMFSPESLDTSSNSWSPEIMDSGYPNSASVHDMTPEYDLSSIANDRISDSDSASVGEEAPLPAFYEYVEVENGDLANNNRDDEGNNVIAFQDNDIDDLQPLIDVLENDIENENDIYVLQNGFPLWLLRILEMGNPIDLEAIGGPHAQLYAAPLQQAGGDAPNFNAENNDEGFDSSSSDDESDIEDDEGDDATTISSDETEDRNNENLRGDWRAGGDP